MKLTKLLPYLILTALVLYGFPLIITDTGSAMSVLLIFIPLACFILAIILCAKHSFQWIYPICVGVLFTPTVNLYYNETATVYVFFYTVISLIGCFIGYLIHKFINRNKDIN